MAITHVHLSESGVISLSSLLHHTGYHMPAIKAPLADTGQAMGQACQEGPCPPAPLAPPSGSAALYGTGPGLLLECGTVGTDNNLRLQVRTLLYSTM